jgi:hypothetical protein
LGCSFVLDFEELSSGSSSDSDGGSNSDDESDDSGDDGNDDGADDTTADDDSSGGDDGSDDDVSDDADADGDAGDDATDDVSDDATDDVSDDATDDTTSDLDGGVDAGGCARNCEDDDPCTVDRCVAGRCENEPMVCEATDACMEASCVNGMCVEAPMVGVVFDGYDETLDGDSIYRSELVGSGDRFYRATYGSWDGQPDVVFSVFDRDADEPLAETRASAHLPEGIVVMSPAALAPDTRLGLTLYAYVAVKNEGQPDDVAGAVALLRFNRDLSLLEEGGVTVVASTSNYRYESDRLGPAAGLTAGGEPFVAWNGCTTSGPTDAPTCVSTEPGSDGQGGIYIQIGDDPLSVNEPGDYFIPDPRPVSGLAVVDTGDAPGAMWMANETPGGVDVTVAMANGQDPVSLVRCNTDDSSTGYALDAWRSLGNLWTTSWSTRMGTSYASELAVLRCLDGACEDVSIAAGTESCSESQSAARVLDGARNVVTRTLARPGDPAERLYQTATAATSDDEGSRVELVVNRLDFDLSQEAAVNSSMPVGRVELSAQDPDEAPGWPALAAVPPDALAVSWVETGDQSGSESVRVQRYRICFGD